MKKGLKTFILIELLLACAFLLLAFFMVREKDTGTPGKVSVIVRDSDDSRWAALKYGLKMAAQDQKTEVFIVTTGEVLSADEEIRLIEDEITNGAKAVIVQPVPGEGMTEALNNVKRRVPVVIIDGAINGREDESGIPFVSADNYAMGMALAEEILSDYNGNVRGKTLGIISETTDSATVTDREQGLYDGLKSEGIEIVWSVSGSFGETAENAIRAQETVDIIAALDDGSLNAAGKCGAAKQLHGAVLYGIGNSMEALYYVDTSVAECLIVPDDFSIGYQSVTEAVMNLKYFFRQPKNKTVSHTAIRKEILFTEETQEMLFAMSQ